MLPHHLGSKINPPNLGIEVLAGSGSFSFYIDKAELVMIVFVLVLDVTHRAVNERRVVQPL
jgi:hypothetical protein